MEKDNVVTKKIVIMGPAASGKTSLVKREVFNIYDDKYLSTVGVNIYKKEVDLLYEDLQYKVKLVLMDTSGDLIIHKHLFLEQIKGANGYMLVFDLTRRDTLLKLAREMAELYLDKKPAVVIGNKHDLIKEFENTHWADISATKINDALKREFDSWMNEHHKDVIDFFKKNYNTTPDFNPVSMRDVNLDGLLGDEFYMMSTSAKTGHKVSDAFRYLTKEMLQKDLQSSI